MTPDDTRRLHVYAPVAWHESATLFGDRAAMLQLRELIDMALASTTAGAEFMHQDGEWYDLRVICSDDETVWHTARLPYTEDVAQDRNEAHVIP